jgi:beta-glucanase (GH16 family)
MQYSSLLLGAAALLTPVFAQTFTDCNPMNQTCPNDPGFGINHNFVFNTSDALTTSFNTTAGTVNFGTDAEFTVAKKGDSPTVKSNFYIFFGSVSVIMKAATGQGIVSSIVLESDDLDEIDWEFIGGNGTHVQTNYFGKGNTTSYDRAKWHPVSTDVRENYHNYTVNWTNEKMDFYIDGGLVRTLMYGDANGGKNYPQTPATVRLGIWAGGDPGNNKYTVEWAGGTTDYSKGPYTMHVSSTNIQDYGTGKEYVWADRTGSWQSIKSLALVQLPY